MNDTPNELKLTFEKLISQMDMVGKTLQIMDQRLLKLENNVGILFNRQRRGFIEPCPDNFNSHNNNDNNNLIMNQQNDIYNVPNNDYVNNLNQGNENYEKSNNLKDTMQYYNDGYNVKNIFNQNLNEGINSNINLNTQELKINDNNNNNNKLTEEKVPVEIFEDIGNHLEDFEKEIVLSNENKNINPEEEQKDEEIKK